MVTPTEPTRRVPPVSAAGGPPGTAAEAARARAAAAARAAIPPPMIDDPLGDPASSVSAWNIANALTVLRLALVPVFLVTLFAHGGHQDGWRVLAWAIFAVASVTDRIDGDIARKRNIVTEFGKLADPIADKALVGAALIGLSLLGELAWWITVVMLGRELGVTLLRFWVIRHGVMPASRGGKLKTLLQGIAIGLYVLPLTGWLHAVATAILYVAIAVALVTGADYVSRALRLRRDSQRAAVSAR